MPSEGIAFLILFAFSGVILFPTDFVRLSISPNITLYTFLVTFKALEAAALAFSWFPSSVSSLFIVLYTSFDLDLPELKISSIAGFTLSPKSSNVPSFKRVGFFWYLLSIIHFL